MKKILIVIFTLVTSLAIAQQKDSIKTSFQVYSKWSPSIDARCDAVILYGYLGLNDNVRTGWSNRGYRTQTMIGIAWGGYSDYFDGTWDGTKHLEEIAQRDMNGNKIMHDPKTPYIIPTMNFLEYLNTKFKKLVDVGITEFFFEEPEIWLAAGYGEAFKNEWQQFYNQPWQPQHKSIENTYKSNKLKHYLYCRAIKEITSDLKEYGKNKGISIKCYVATHSIINYSLWNIVSPEGAISDMESVDGLIAQVWTGTSRNPNFYNGSYNTRMFEMALMEYSSLEAITRPVKKDMFFLSDPIEDAPQNWELYKKGYEATYTAEILYPDIDKYEIMPWPDRIFKGRFKTSPKENTYEPIPPSYATQMQIMVNALMTMPRSNNKISGPQGISLLLSNSIMFQRFAENRYEDVFLSNCWGLVMPLLKSGIHVKTIFMNNLKYGLEETKILLMTYSSMKPADSEEHQYIASWVKNGGILVYHGKDNDRFQNIGEWRKKEYGAASDHLFSLMGIGTGPKSGIYKYGKGTVLIERTNPETYVRGGATKYMSQLKKLYTTHIGPFNYSNNFTLARGIYEITAVLSESFSDSPVIKRGLFVDLFTDSLPVIRTKIIKPGSQSLLINLDKIDKSRPSVLATAARAYDEKYDSKTYSFITKGPENVKGVTRVYLPFKPSIVTIGGIESYDPSCWDSVSSTYLLKYDCNPEGTIITLATGF